ncbi:MAG: DUF1932 domain-containing protein [Sphingomonadales bacterium]
MRMQVALIGFGEAGSTFASAAGWNGATTAFDRLTDSESTRAGMLARYSSSHVDGKTTLADAMGSTNAALSVVTAEQALAVAHDAARHVEHGSFYFDMNSVAPETKRDAARVIEAVGGRYVDVAVMSPVDPARLNVPLLVSGPHADDGKAVLQMLGFTNVRVLPGDVGRASSVKMIRSVMVKGIEALTAEMLLAGEAAGVTDEVLASLGDGWAKRADYNLDRMLVHGTRRAAEMREVAKTLEALGVAPAMTRATVQRQSEFGAIDAGSPDGLSAKLRLAA